MSDGGYFRHEGDWFPLREPTSLELRQAALDGMVALMHNWAFELQMLRKSIEADAHGLSRITVPHHFDGSEIHALPNEDGSHQAISRTFLEQLGEVSTGTRVRAGVGIPVAGGVSTYLYPMQWEWLQWLEARGAEYLLAPAAVGTAVGTTGSHLLSIEAVRKKLIPVNTTKLEKALRSKTLSTSGQGLEYYVGQVETALDELKHERSRVPDAIYKGMPLLVESTLDRFSWARPSTYVSKIDGVWNRRIGTLFARLATQVSPKDRRDESKKYWDDNLPRTVDKNPYRATAASAVVRSAIHGGVWGAVGFLEGFAVMPASLGEALVIMGGGVVAGVTSIYKGKVFADNVERIGALPTAIPNYDARDRGHLKVARGRALPDALGIIENLGAQVREFSKRDAIVRSDLEQLCEMFPMLIFAEPMQLVAHTYFELDKLEATEMRERLRQWQLDHGPVPGVKIPEEKDWGLGRDLKL